MERTAAGTVSNAVSAVNRISQLDATRIGVDAVAEIWGDWDGTTRLTTTQTEEHSLHD